MILKASIVAEIETAENLRLSPLEMQNRWYYEQEKLRLFPEFALLGPGYGPIKAAEGVVTTQYNNTYGVRITLTNYPYALPTIHPKDWTVHLGCKHKFNDGSLCIMRSNQWRKYFTIALVVAKTAIWLNKYELWKRNGHHWPGLGQRH